MGVKGRNNLQKSVGRPRVSLREMARQSQMVSDRRALPHRVMKTCSKINERREETAMLQEDLWKIKRERIQNRDKWVSWGVNLRQGREGSRFPSRPVFSPVSGSQAPIIPLGAPQGIIFSTTVRKFKWVLFISPLLFHRVSKKREGGCGSATQRPSLVSIFLLLQRWWCCIICKTLLMYMLKGHFYCAHMSLVLITASFPWLLKLFQFLLQFR